MASILKVDTLTGVTTAGSISVTGEGNSTTTNLQQGLAKVWVNLNQDATPSIRGSNNVSSVSDEGVGATQTNFTSLTADANYALAGTSGDEAGNSGCWHSTGYNANSYNTSNTTSSFHQQIYYSTNQVADSSFVYCTLHGDLA